MNHKIISLEKVRRPLVLLAALGLFIIIFVPSVMAHCPLCTGATIVGVSLTRAMGWDDSIVGVFVGGMIISTALWTDKALKKRNIGVKGNQNLRLISLIALMTILTLVTFYYAGLFGKGNSYRIWGMESILFGSISGGVLSLAAFYFSNHLKNKNGGKTLFNYQTLVLSLGALILNAATFAFLF